MKTTLLFPLASVALACSSLVAAAEAAWVTDFDAAKTMAAKQKKDLYVNFTGSDW